MDLRHKRRPNFVGFTEAEVQKMEGLLNTLRGETLKDDFCKNMARVFNRSSGRAGKPIAKWTEIQNWFRSNLEQGDQDEELSPLEFEAQSSKDGAWYDVDTFISHRFHDSGKLYVGFSSEQDEWVNARDSLRTRSIPLDRSECNKVKVGDQVVCFQEKEDQAKYYDARVIEIERRWHDMRGCRCLFLIKYDHDNAEERVRSRRLCRRP